MKRSHLVIVLVVAFTSIAQAQNRDACNVRQHLAIGDTIFEATGQSVLLNSIDMATTVRWSFAIFLPGLAKDEVGVHLYPLDGINETHAGFLSSSYIALFIVCRQVLPDGRIKHWGTRFIPSSDIDPTMPDIEEYTHIDEYIGVTIPIPELPSEEPAMWVHL